MKSKEMLKVIVNALEEKKGEQIKIIDISKVSVIADYFVIASGSNENQIRAMADAVEEELLKKGVHHRQSEGYQTARWILMDYQDVIIHIFNEEDRLFYDIERIWSDGIAVDKDSVKEDNAAKEGK